MLPVANILWLGISTEEDNRGLSDSGLNWQGVRGNSTGLFDM